MKNLTLLILISLFLLFDSYGSCSEDALVFSLKVAEDKKLMSEKERLSFEKSLQPIMKSILSFSKGPLRKNGSVTVHSLGSSSQGGFEVEPMADDEYVIYIPQKKGGIPRVTFQKQKSSVKINHQLKKNLNLI